MNKKLVSLIIIVVGIVVAVLYDSGEVKYTYYDNGVVSTKRPYKNGMLDGELKVYSKDGRIRRMIKFKDNKQHGEEIFYYENGNIEYKFNYKEGKRHYVQISYYENGKRKNKWNCKDGEPHGEYISYYKSGEKKASGFYKYAYHKKTKVRGEYFKDDVGYYKNKNIKYKELLLVSGFSGKTRSILGNYEFIYEGKYYNIKGDLVSEVIDGNGEAIIYNGNGNIQYKYNYKDGKRHGEVIEYYEDGGIKFKVNYKDGVMIK